MGKVVSKAYGKEKVTDEVAYELMNKFFGDSKNSSKANSLGYLLKSGIYDEKSEVNQAKERFLSHELLKIHMVYLQVNIENKTILSKKMMNNLKKLPYMTAFF